MQPSPRVAIATDPDPPVCAEHHNRGRDGMPGCMEAATKRGPCDACDGSGRRGFEQCFTIEYPTRQPLRGIHSPMIW